MNGSYPERRKHPRLQLRLPANISYRSTEGFIVREMTFTSDVSPVGAGLVLRPELDVGQIIEIALPLPAEMRFVDARSDVYDIWAVVRHCNPIRSEKIPVNRIGVAFVGPQPPAAYFREPLRLFELDGFDAAGFWKATETGATVNRRRQTRFAIPLGVSLTVLDLDGHALENERTVTENVSLGGASVFSSLSVRPGDLVKILSEQYNVTLTAEVRNVRTGQDGLPRIHLRFIDGAFPLKGIESV